MSELAAAGWLLAYFGVIVGLGAAAIRYAARPRGAHRAGSRRTAPQSAAPPAGAEPPQRPDPVPVCKLFDPLDDTTLQTALDSRRRLAPDGEAGPTT